MTSTHQEKLGKLAALWDMTPDEVMRAIEEDFERLGHMQPGHLPFAWRDSRLKYAVRVPAEAGPWVDMDQQATLDALSIMAGATVAPLTGRDEVDRATTFSNDRDVTHAPGRMVARPHFGRRERAGRG